MELVLVVCLSSSPHLCEERSIGLYPDISAMACLAQGQPQIALWIEQHPGLAVARYSCRDVNGREQRA